MARVFVATQPWGVLWQQPAADLIVKLPASGTAASINTTVYSASTGSGTVASFVTNNRGELPGYVEEGTYTLTVGASSWVVEAVGGTSIKVLKEAPLNVKLPPYNMKLDGSTADDAGLASAVAALPAGGGELYFPRGTAVLNSQFPSLDSKRGIALIGEGSPGNGFGMGTELIYTGTAGPFISAKQTQGLLIERLGIRYNNSSFAGYLIDLRNTSGSGGNDTRDITIRRCYLGSNPSGLTSCLGLLRCANAHGIKVEDTAMADAQRAIIGREGTGDYCIGLSVEGCSIFERFVQAPLHNAGDSWSVSGPTRVEQLTNGRAGLYTHDAAILAKGLSFRDLWLGDVNASGGYWIKWAGTGLILEGGVTAHESAGGGAILVDGNDCRGLEVRGGDFIGGAQVIDFGTTTGHHGVRIAPGKLSQDPVSLTTPALTAGTIPPLAHLLNPTTGKWALGDADGWNRSGGNIIETTAAAVSVTGQLRTNGSVFSGAALTPITMGGVTFSAISAASAANNTIFLDSADNVLKKKNNAGTVSNL